MRCKGDYLLKVLLKTAVPAPLAIELALHGREHDLIKLGTQKDGLCTEYGFKKEKFHKLHRRLKRCLKELGDLTNCTLFLNNNTLTAVDPSPRLCWARHIVKSCIIKNRNPADVISSYTLKHDQRVSYVRDLEFPNMVNEDGADEVTLSFHEAQAKRMERAMPKVGSYLEKYCISCTLNLSKRTVTITTTEATKEYPGQIIRTGWGAA